MGELVGMETRGRWYTPTLEEKMEYVEYYGTDELHYCKHPWALRHYWVNKETGMAQRARCNRWECRHCGPRKVNLWRQLVKEAEPTLFLTLSKAGRTVEEARRALTTFMQALRRGSKGRGKNHVGAREAYPIEYFAVLEKHRDFERNGFHWHILAKGVEYIPYKEVLQPLWMSATHYRPATEEDEGRGAMIADIQRVRNTGAIGYVTKYLMKALTDDERGTKQVKERHQVAVLEPAGEGGYHLKHDEGGEMVLEQEEVEVERVSKAHRLCYSRHFFPEQVAELRKRLFAGVEHEVMGEAPVEGTQEDGEQEQRSPWLLMERKTDEFVDVPISKGGMRNWRKC